MCVVRYVNCMIFIFSGKIDLTNALINFYAPFNRLEVSLCIELTAEFCSKVIEYWKFLLNYNAANVRNWSILVTCREKRYK